MFIIVSDWMERNRPYVKYGAVIGFDGRKNITFTSSKEQAIEFLMKQ